MMQSTETTRKGAGGCRKASCPAHRPEEERMKGGGEMKFTAICMMVLWGAFALAMLVCRKWTPEIWRWYRWYALVVLLLSTVVLLGSAAS